MRRAPGERIRLAEHDRPVIGELRPIVGTRPLQTVKVGPYTPQLARLVRQPYALEPWRRR